MVSFPYHSHIFRESYGNSMGPAYHKEVPCPWGSLKIPLTLKLNMMDGNILPIIPKIRGKPLAKNPQKSNTLESRSFQGETKRSTYQGGQRGKVRGPPEKKRELIRLFNTWLFQWETLNVAEETSQNAISFRLHPRKLTCPLKRDYFCREYIFQSLIFRGHSLVFMGVVDITLGCTPSNSRKWRFVKVDRCFPKKLRVHPFLFTGHKRQISIEKAIIWTLIPS